MQQSSATPSYIFVFQGCGRLLHALKPTLQCSTVFGTVSSLHFTSFLMIFTLINMTEMRLESMNSTSCNGHLYFKAYKLFLLKGGIINSGIHNYMYVLHQRKKGIGNARGRSGCGGCDVIRKLNIHK